jgi:hypothetical protein
MIIIGIILSIIGIIGGIYLICDGIVNIENRDNISSGILFILLNVVLLFIYLKNLGWI